MRCFPITSLAAALLLASATLPAAAAESAGSYMDDTAISTKIKAALVKDQELKAFDIHVETDHGVVHLTGSVDSSIQKADAVRIAKGTENVRDVVNDIVVTKR